MQFPAEIDNIKTLKNGMKITIAIEDDNVKEVLQHIYNFIDKPLEIDLEVDAAVREKELNQISGPQRKKIYALMRDIGQELGYDTESIKKELKHRFCYDNEYEMFSLSNCSRDLASNFIEFLIRFAFEQGISLSEVPKDYFEDIEDYIRLCLEKQVCCVCGRSYSGDPHHVDTIGMGHDRQKVDDSDKLALPLCYEEHHPGIHTIGDESFCEKYHVVPVKIGD